MFVDGGLRCEVFVYVCAGGFEGATDRNTSGVVSNGVDGVLGEPWICAAIGSVDCEFAFVAVFVEGGFQLRGRTYG